MRATAHNRTENVNWIYKYVSQEICVSQSSKRTLIYAFDLYSHTHKHTANVNIPWNICAVNNVGFKGDEGREQTINRTIKEIG